MCSSLLDLVPGSRDLSQTMSRFTIHYFSLKMVKIVNLSENSYYFVSCSACVTTLSQLEINHVIQQPNEEI